MKEFSLSPMDWGRLTVFDKKILHYYRVMDGHYTDQTQESYERDRERERKKQELINNLPKQQTHRGR